MKQAAGCSFFVTQVVYDVNAAKNLVSDYRYECLAQGLTPVPIVFTFSKPYRSTRLSKRSMSCGSRPRTRETLSRTSAAAASGSRESLKVRVRCGLMPLRCQTRRMVVALNPVCSASVRVLQCVAAAGLVCNVTCRIFDSTSAVTVGVRPEHLLVSGGEGPKFNLKVDTVEALRGPISPSGRKSHRPRC